MTNDNPTERTDEVRKRIGEDSVLGDFAVPLPQLSLSTRRDDLQGTFERLGELIDKSGKQTTVNFKVRDETGVHTWSLKTGPNGSTVVREDMPLSDFEISVSAETWFQLANGEISPLEAFVQGKMRVRGNVNIARRIIRLLQPSTG